METTVVSKVGNDVKGLIDACTRLGFTLADIATFLGVRRSTVWKWYRGFSKPRSPEEVVLSLEKLLEANGWRLDVSYYSHSHNAVESRFAFKPVQVPIRTRSYKQSLKRIIYGKGSKTLNEAKGRLVAVCGRLNITNKAFMETCGRILEDLHASGRLRYRRDVDVYALATVKLVALMFKVSLKINPEDYGVSEEEYLEKLLELIRYYHNRL